MLVLVEAKACLVLQEGDLDTYLKKRGHNYIPEDEIMLKFVQIALALHYIHGKVCRCHGMGMCLLSLQLVHPTCPLSLQTAPHSCVC